MNPYRCAGCDEPDTRIADLERRLAEANTALDTAMAEVRAWRGNSLPHHHKGYVPLTGVEVARAATDANALCRERLKENA